MPVNSVKVWRIENNSLRTRFEETGLGNVKRLWRSTSNLDPYPPCRDGFDPEDSGGGAYGKGVYFAEHALYCDFFIRPPTTSMEIDINGKGSFLIFADVALGECKDFGSEMNDETRSLVCAPKNYDSWTGTEGDLEGKGGAGDLVSSSKRKEEGDSRKDAFHLRRKDNGSIYGRQYIVGRADQILPRYLVRYSRDGEVSEGKGCLIRTWNMLSPLTKKV